MFHDAQVTIMVADLDRAVRFYTDALGLELKGRYGDEFAEARTPGMTIGLHPPSAHGPQPSQGESVSIGFAVEQLESAMAQLKAKGVAFNAPIVADGPMRFAAFADPDQTPLYLWEAAQRPQEGS